MAISLEIGKNDKMTSGMGINNGTCLNTLLYTDDKILIEESQDYLQRSVYLLGKLASEYNMEISVVKTKLMAFKVKDPVT